MIILFLVNILVFILVLGLVILIHELGHFLMAKKAGILCHEFALGMGPILYSKKIGETLYSIRAIPIGGFVMMAGEEVNDEMIKIGQAIKVKKNANGLVDEIILDVNDPHYEDCEAIDVFFVDLKGRDEGPLMINEHRVDTQAYYIMKGKRLQIAPYNRSFESKTISQRFGAIFAGPFMNFVLAFVLFVLIAFIVGFPVIDSNELGDVRDNSPASQLFEIGDRVISVGDTEVDSWVEFVNAMARYEGTRNLPIEVLRGDREIAFTINPRIYIYSIGISSHIDTSDVVRIGPVIDGTLADQAGFLSDDVIVAVDGTDINDWATFIQIMKANTAGNTMQFTLLRGSDTVELNIQPYDEGLLNAQGVRIVESLIGVSPTTERAFLRSFVSGAVGVRNSATMIFDTLRLLINNDRVGVGDLAGPIGIYTITSQALAQGFVVFLNWTALLSVNLGILNLLPIPALDGGRLVFLGYEGITKRKVNKRVENTLHLVMFMLLMGLFIFVAYNDILRLFNLR